MGELIVELSKNKYDFFGKSGESENPFMGIFDHDGLKRSSGVRPVRDTLRSASPTIPDVSNFNSDVKNKEIQETGFSDEGEVSEGPLDFDLDLSNELEKKEVGLSDSVFNAKELREEGKEFMNEKGLKIDKKISSREVGGVVQPGVSKEAARGDISQDRVNILDPYLHDMDDESEYAANHPGDYTDDPAFPVMDARAQLLNLDIDRGVKEYLLGCLNNYKSANANGEIKEAKLSPEDEKKVEGYWSKVLYPKDYAKDMVKDYELEGKDSDKSKKSSK